MGLTTQPKFIALSLFIALNVSVSALVARRKGQKDRDGANQVLMMALGFTLVMGLVLGAVCIAFAPTFMDLAGSNAETHDNAVLYFRIVVGGMIFSVLSLIINAAQRGSGNTRLSMRANVASSLVNITFNWLLINGHLGFPALGMKGAALATVLGTVVACCMSISSILREDSFVSIPYMLRKKVRPGAENALVMVKLCASCFSIINSNAAAKDNQCSKSADNDGVCKYFKNTKQTLFYRMSDIGCCMSDRSGTKTCFIGEDTTRYTLFHTGK